MARRRSKDAGTSEHTVDNAAPGVSAAPITGVASGGLGTAANLEDTQLWNLEDLREPAPNRTDRAARGAGHAPLVPTPAPQRVPRGPVRRGDGQRRTGLVAATVVGVLALAALLASRDGLPSGGPNAAGDAAGAFPSLPPISSSAPLVTAPPEGGGGGGNGHGGGNGNGNGGGNGHGGGGNR